MHYILAAALAVLNLLWLSLNLLGLPGNWLIVLATGGLAWWGWSPNPAERVIGIAALITILALALAGELVELLAGLAGSKRAGGSRWGAAGALAGSIIGGLAGTALLTPVIGTLLGACLGATAGAWLLETCTGQPLRKSVNSGIGAGLGRFTGTIAKLALGVAIWLVSTVAAFWP